MAFMRDEISLFIRELWDMSGVQHVSLGQPLVMKQITDEEMNVVQSPTLSVTPEEAQQFMDELWRCGIRPTEGAGSVGQLGAIKAHLEDMRTLVFKKP